MAVLAEQLDLLGKAVGHGHVAAIVPERTVVTRCAVIMKDKEIADTRIFLAGQAIERVFLRLRHAIERQQRNQFVNPCIHKVQRGGLKRLHKARCQAKRDNILVPKLFTSTRYKAQEIRLSARFSSDVVDENRMCLVIRHIFIAIDMAVAVAVLQRNLPLPSRRMRGRARIGQWTAAIFTQAWQCYRTVAGQIIGPIVITRFQRLFDQQAAEARAINKQIALQHVAIFHGHRRYKAAFIV